MHQFLSCKDQPRPTIIHHHLSLPSLPLSEEEGEEEMPAITHKFQTLTSNPNVCILIDMENVRGKTSFELDHSDLLDRLLIWTKLRRYASGRTIVVVDHCSKSTAHLLSSHYCGSDERVGDSIPRPLMMLLLVMFIGYFHCHPHLSATYV